MAKTSAAKSKKAVKPAPARKKLPAVKPKARKAPPAKPAKHSAAVILSKKPPAEPTLRLVGLPRGIPPPRRRPPAPPPFLAPPLPQKMADAPSSVAHKLVLPPAAPAAPQKPPIKPAAPKPVLPAAPPSAPPPQSKADAPSSVAHKPVSPPAAAPVASAAPAAPVTPAAPTAPPRPGPSFPSYRPRMGGRPGMHRPRPHPAPPKAEKPAAPETVQPVSPPAAEPVALKPFSVRVPLTVKELAEKLNISPSELIKRLIGMKIMATINQLLTEEPVRGLVKLYGFEFQALPTLEEEIEAVHEIEDPAQLKPRPPVVTLMGHVDHGKTSLLDAIRKSKVAEGEAGGITQHIGAYRVSLPKGSITFLDTPGHEAFTAMRARGARVTDIVILVVAADDGVMPQTIEAIDHAKAAEATIVVAMNKIDKPQANPDRLKKQLAELNLMPEDWGGKTIVAPVSAKTGEGIDHLLEMVLLEASLLELKADPAKPARGIVLEAQLSKGGGPTAHVLVQKGTLRVGDVLVSGPYWGRVRAMLDERASRLQEASPSTPLEILGLNGVPKAGDSFLVVGDEKKAREVVTRRQEETRSGQVTLTGRHAVSLEDFHKLLAEGKLKSLNLILKADVQGSAEALQDALSKISSDEVSFKVLHSGVGDVTEPDVLLAEASAAVVIGFHVGMTPEAEILAKQEKVDVRLYRIIYEAIADIRAALEGLLAPKLVESSLGKAKVLQVFKVSKSGTIAGCQVLKGKILRGALARVFRGPDQLFEGKISSLKRFKEDVREVAEGFQCGISVSGWSEFQPEDLIEVIEVESVAQKL
ncbi:MAG: translation initiation factor IF-2 [Candidatus Omnitrophica bacterium]|nr:translation initiation factor IF-2 [Candidatus Omnitrophota bacterium]